MTEALLLPRPRRIDLGSVGRVAVGPVEVVPAIGMPPEGYRIRIEPEGVRVEATDAAGAAHARRTLDQLATDGYWPDAVIEDWPDFAVRGVMLDVSRDKVPTMATLESLIEQLAAWKVNHLQLYVEHTFAHPGLEDVWEGASPFTAEEIAHLDGFCRERFIELVPNQNTLGHMERYLIHPRWRSLALEPDGFMWLGFLPRPAATLDPRRAEAFDLATRLVGDWCDALPSAVRFHVGMDEPWELGDDLLGEYMSWLERLASSPVLRDREVLIWGDVLSAHPELIASVPDGVTVIEWGYEADHPWADRLTTLADSGATRWVACGTSSWSSLLGRSTNMIDNIGAAVDAALADGDVAGVLNADWGDWGHLQHLPVSYPGLAWGAAQSWCRSSNRGLDLASALDSCCTESTGDGWGACLLALGDAHRAWGRPVPNIASCFLNLWMNQLPVRGVEPGAVDAVRRAIDSALTLGDPGDEIRATVTLGRLLLDDDEARLAGDGRIDSVPGARRREFAGRLDQIIGTHRDLWLRRNRPGGLADSVAWLENIGEAYRSGHAAASWSGPLRAR